MRQVLQWLADQTWGISNKFSQRYWGKKGKCSDKSTRRAPQSFTAKGGTRTGGTRTEGTLGLCRTGNTFPAALSPPLSCSCAPKGVTSSYNLFFNLLAEAISIWFCTWIVLQSLGFSVESSTLVWWSAAVHSTPWITLLKSTRRSLCVSILHMPRGMYKHVSKNLMSPPNCVELS